jgi:hypothetical protein
MFGVDVAAVYVFGWLVRKAKRAAQGVDAEIDRTVDAGVGRLHDLVTAKLGGDQALQRAREEAGAGDAELSERTRRRLTDALEDAAEHDQDLAGTFAAIENAGPTSGRQPVPVSTSGGWLAQLKSLGDRQTLSATATYPTARPVWRVWGA